MLTGDETWVHMFEPQRRADNKQWKRKDKKKKKKKKKKNAMYCQDKFEKDVRNFL